MGFRASTNQDNSDGINPIVIVPAIGVRIPLGAFITITAKSTRPENPFRLLTSTLNLLVEPAEITGELTFGTPESRPPCKVSWKDD